MDLIAATSCSVALPATPHDLASYFSRNDSLLARLIGPGRVQDLGGGLYRVSLRRFEALGLAVRPELEVRFTDLPGRCAMRAERACLAEGPSGLSLEVAFEGEARFEPHGGGSLLVCEAEALVTLGLPFPFSMLPERSLQIMAEAVLKSAMNTTARRFAALIAENFDEARLCAAA